jgi:Na+/H+ antiporter NhaA
VTIKFEVEYVTESVESLLTAFVFPAISATPPAKMRGMRVPSPDELAATLNVVLFTCDIDQEIPVAVPIFPISAAVNDDASIGSLNVAVKFIGTEFVSDG